MDTVLDFFSDLILFTAGLVVATGWLILIMLASVEAYDLIMEKFFGRKPVGPLTPDEEDA